MIKAAAVIFRYNDNIFAIKRQSSLRVFPGYHAFAGGKVDEQDYLHDDATADSDLESVLLTTATREIQEEMSCDLISLVDQGIASSPQLFGVAISPPFNPYKFETYYFLVELKEKVEFKLEPFELEYGYWKTPSELLDIYEQGKILCVPPLIKILKALQGKFHQKYQSELLPTSIYDFSLQVNEAKEIPMIEPVSGIKHFFVPSDTLPPALFTNCFLIDGVLIDPSPKDEQVLEKLLYSLKKEKIRSVFITHHHPDHHQFADRIAHAFQVPMLMSETTKKRVANKYSPFNCNDIKIVDQQSIIGEWKGEPIKIMSVPGHDDGQLAPYVESRSWLIASDLFQYGATVVAGGEEGDMGAYQQTLKKVIDFNPNVIFPSHGIGVWGVHWLQIALEHTYMRNSQVKEALNQGLSIDQMLQSIYQGVNPKLLRYAKKNILSHIDLIKKGES
jgi:glyoxylase-like metal-dependent hydrolase (beta-lactamase superfamily II)/8-oxo-dGTP pyrophosphatase MutT (NUDIX family)